MSFQVQYAIALPNEIGLVHNEYRRFDRSVIEEPLHVFRIEPQAPIGRCKADAGRFIGAMDQITRFAQIECVFSQGIIRPRRDDCGEDIPFLAMFLGNRSRNMPGRPDCLARHMHGARGGRPLSGADTDRVGRYQQRRPILFVLKKPHGGQVDHNPFSGSVRQDKTERQHDTLSGLRYPYVYPWIRRTDCIDPQTEVPGNIRERISLFKPDNRQPPNDVVSSCNRKLVSLDLLFMTAWKKLCCLLNSFHCGTSREREDEYTESSQTKPVAGE